MLTLWNQVDDLFADDMWKNRRAAPRSFVPATDIEETKEGYRLTADVPGMKPEQIDITVEDGVLTVRGERKTEHSEDKEGYRRIERHFGSFQRSFVLPKGVDADKVEATVQHGQLMVFVPKPVAQLPKKVNVRPAGELEEVAAE